MPIRMITSKLIEIGTSLFMITNSCHYNLPEKSTVPTTTTTAVTTTTTTTTTTKQTTALPKKNQSSAHKETTTTTVQNVANSTSSDNGFNLTASTISVSCIKLTWNGDENSEYTVTLTQIVPDDYIDNVYFEFKSNTLCYVTGLRENTEYQFDVSDADRNILATTTGKTETVEVVEECGYVDGWTNCFTYEFASGLVNPPASTAIAGCSVDQITNTGIMRDEYGDYCCAMGTYFGYDGDRMLIELENGTQFTVKLCDSKGNRWYHNYGNGGKSVVEFIVDDNSLPYCVYQTGNYGSYNWYGLNFDNIKSVKMINYGDPVEY